LDLDAVDDNCNIDSIQNSNSSVNAKLHNETVDNVEQLHIENKSTTHRIACAEQLRLLQTIELSPCFDVHFAKIMG
jgi:hypothetical protein